MHFTFSPVQKRTCLQRARDEWPPDEYLYEPRRAKARGMTAVVIPAATSSIRSICTGMPTASKLSSRNITTH